MNICVSEGDPGCVNVPACYQLIQLTYQLTGDQTELVKSELALMKKNKNFLCITDGQPEESETKYQFICQLLAS